MLRSLIVATITLATTTSAFHLPSVIRDILPHHTPALAPIDNDIFNNMTHSISDILLPSYKRHGNNNADNGHSHGGGCSSVGKTG